METEHHGQGQVLTYISFVNNSFGLNFLFVQQSFEDL